jgi:predicted TPR repeat methyltransferase
MTRSQSSTTASNDPSLQGLMQAERFIQQRQFKEAAGVLNQLQTQVVGDPRIYMMGMRLAEAAGQPEGALKAARQAVKVSPQWAPAVLDLALLLARQNKFVDAANEAQKAVALAPGHLPTLHGAIDIAHRAGFAALALEFLPKAIELAAPNHLHYQRQMALDLYALGRNEEAVALFNNILANHPGDTASLAGLADSSMARGDKATAQQCWDRLVELDPNNEGYRFNQQVAYGKIPAVIPESATRALFDDMAGVFDQHLVGSLGYKLPKQVADWILQKYPTRELNVLDLGCGTGLLGACLGQLRGYIVGVDLSSKMIEQAARHGVYYKIHQVGIADAVANTPENHFEVVTALDVFTYLGDLSQIIPNAHRVAKPNGYVIFSCERALETEADWLLRPTKRYAQKQSHIEHLCRNAGFVDVTVQDTTIRFEGTEPINGFLVVARKAAAGEAVPVFDAEEKPKAKAVRKPRVAKNKAASDTP